MYKCDRDLTKLALGGGTEKWFSDPKMVFGVLALKRGRAGAKGKEDVYVIRSLAGL